MSRFIKTDYDKIKLMTTTLIMILAITIGSLLSLGLSSLLFLFKKRRRRAVALTLPIGAGALLAAAFFDLLPEAIDAIDDVESLMSWVAVGFLAFFLLERFSSWFHHHHEHEHSRDEQQNRLMIAGDVIHNLIDGVAIGAAFLVSVPTGIVTALAVSAHEIPKEFGTFGILLSRGWRDKKVIAANLMSAIGTIIGALLVFSLGNQFDGLVAVLLAVTAGFFIYVAASDIIPDIHEQTRRMGSTQAVILILAFVTMTGLIELLHDFH